MFFLTFISMELKLRNNLRKLTQMVHIDVTIFDHFFFICASLLLMSHKELLWLYAV